MPESKFSFKTFLSFLISKAFLKHFILIIGFLLIVLISLFTWLRVYTNHGQELELPDYRNMSFEEVKKDAKSRKFIIVVDDSTHIVGKKGGLILDQNPKALSKVKENRKVYVTITKYNPDKIRLKDLPKLYGKNYNSKKRELSIMKINSKIKDYKYDLGEPNHILEAYYNGELIISKVVKKDDLEIEKGATINFILSKKSGGNINIPNLRCMTLEQAIFLLETTNLEIGAIRKNGVITNEGSGWVVRQNPRYSHEATVVMGSTIELEISDDKPADCN